MVGEGARILVVDDDEPLASAIDAGLRAEGFDVTVSHDGPAAFALTEDQRFDAIVLDLMLPRLNGFRFCGAMRERGDFTPVLVLTAKQGEWDEAEALEIGADDYLKKPFSYVVLVAHLRALLRRHDHDRLVDLVAGDLRLDLRAHRCMRGTTDIALTPREFALLEVLMRRAGEAITKRELLDEIWDWAIDNGSNLVEVYIGYLRRKVDVPFGRHAIETVRGAGYRLDPDGG
jgi:two-component system, OmpR family, response regulator